MHPGNVLQISCFCVAVYHLERFSLLHCIYSLQQRGDSEGLIHLVNIGAGFHIKPTALTSTQAHVLAHRTPWLSGVPQSKYAVDAYVYLVN